MRMRKDILFLCCLLTLTSVNARTVHPVNGDEALVNPGMGWVYYHFSNRLWAYGGLTEQGDALDWFPGVSTIYLRVPWSAIEPEEGDFRWDLLDSYAQPFIDKGKKIALRITSSESRYVYATPKWVKDAGAKGIFFKLPGAKDLKGWATSDLELWEPTFDDPVFLAKLENFLRALAARYDGNPNVAFIDVGSFGMWGEGHTGNSSRLSQERTNSIMSLHMRLYRKHFKSTYLVVSDDVSGGENHAEDAELMQLARQLGIGFRDDSILVYVPDEKTGKASWFHDGWARKFEAEGLPVVAECEHYDLSVDRGAWDAEKLIRSVEAYQASWLSIHGWPKRFLEKNRSAIDAINRKLGYRLELREASWPDKAKVGERIEIAAEWVNVGVAACHRGGFVIWTLLNDDNKVVWTSVDSGWNVRSLVPTLKGEEHPFRRVSACRFGYDDALPQQNDAVLNKTREHRIWDPGSRVPTLRPGDYALCVSVGKADATPELALPLPGAVCLRYPIGRISIVQSDFQSQEQANERSRQ